MLPDLCALATVTSRLLGDMKGRIVRCRNYYRIPRRGPSDPYRAIHLELQSDDDEFVELQLTTARREAVGQVDHAIVHKKRIPFACRSHARWLRDLSWSANILDAQDLL